jgi:hypothetical protein
MDAKTAAALDRAARQTVDTLWLRKEQDRLNRERREQAKKIKEDGRVYRRALLDTALDFCPPIRPCPDCGYPQLDGYLCTYCPEPKETSKR